MKLLALTGEEADALRQLLSRAELETLVFKPQIPLLKEIAETLDGKTPVGNASDAIEARTIDALQQAGVAIDEVLGEDGYEATDLLSCECTFDENRGDERGKPCAHTALRGKSSSRSTSCSRRWGCAP